MKKAYINPSMEVITVEPSELMTQSLQILDTEVNTVSDQLVREEAPLPKHDVWNEW